MKLNFIYERGEYVNSQTMVFTEYEKIVRELRPDLDITYVNAILERETLQYTGGVCKYNPFCFIIENAETKKYILVSYMENHDSLFRDPKYSHYDIDLMVDFISSSGMLQNSTTCQFGEHIPANYTPFSYITMNKITEEAIEKCYSSNITKIVPNKLRFRGYAPDLCRKYFIHDSRFDGIDKVVEGGYLTADKYIEELSVHKVCLNLNGSAEICHRDIEIMGLGNVLIRPTLQTKFHDPLIPGYHYIGVDYTDYKNHNKLANDTLLAFDKIKNDDRLMDFIGKNAREWYVRNGTVRANAEILTRIVDFDKLK